MRTALGLLAALLFVSPLLHAESHNPADYPLRLHIYGHNQTTFYHNRQTDEVKGEGRGNLFENGNPRGIDFQYECDHRFQNSSGWETYPAKWKKQDAELVVLFPQFGKPGSYDSCHLKVEMKDFAYYTRNGSMYTEPAAVFKTWMTKHEYDPEHGKNMPVGNTPAVAGAPAAGAAPAPASTPAPGDSPAPMPPQ